MPYFYKKRQMKLVNDCVHGHIYMPPLCVAIIDTPIFQRLRYLKQTGFAYFVYPGACHNRFEHSLGVCFLAGEFVDALNDNHDQDRKISESEKLCLQVAGLCHDLGHGPFSHTWEIFIKKATGSIWKHEEMSAKLLDKIFEEPTVQAEFEKSILEEEDKKFIKQLIQGNSSSNKSKAYLFQIISNSLNGIDVDKWDYLLRDSKQLGISIMFDYRRLMMSSRIVKVKKPDHTVEYHLAFREKEFSEICKMYLMRAELHRVAFQHRVVKIIEEMWIDTLLTAEQERFHFCGKKLSEAHNYLDIFVLLTDHIFQDLLNSSSLKNTLFLLHRIQYRNLYDLCGIISWKKEYPEKEKEVMAKCEEHKLTGLIVHTGIPVEMLCKNVYLYGKDNIRSSYIAGDAACFSLDPWDTTTIYLVTKETGENEISSARTAGKALERKWNNVENIVNMY